MKKYLLSLALFVIATPALANTTGYAWSESLGWFDFSNAAVSDTNVTGYAYNDNTGWLVLDGITNDAGYLSGYAWSESVGYFDFSDVSITNGTFDGYAYNDNTGWLSFSDGTTVTTTWLPAEIASSDDRSRGSRGGSRKRIMISTTTPNVNTPDIIPNITAPSSPNAIANNPRDLELNMTGDDVRLLQQFLNQRGYIVNPNPGQSGSMGYETNYFGNLTKQALIKFQQANNIQPSLGYFGPITKSFIRTLLTN